MTLLFELALTLYFAATIVGIVEFFKGSRATTTIMNALIGAGFVFHTANILMRLYVSGHLPITNLHEASSFFSWCIVLLFFFIEYRYRIGLLGSFIMPVVFILMIASSILPRGIKQLSPVLQSYWLGVHTFLAFLGDASFAMAAGIGVMYLVQEHFLKKKHLGSLFQRLPNLQVLDEINYRLITIGFPLLTLAILTGAIWAENAWGSYWRWDPKEVWSLITWFIYVLVLHVRLKLGWKGKKAAILSIIGFAVVLFTFFGVNLLLKGMHTFVK
ncbi:cytochrome c biogenesis protein CcsA [bacterium BMS3Bbin06]|nr:cytochrome c biogenesis protein CcsA [bacterium BMS3Abin08]GBE33949.1 cytochrome c biogenesis protein CcsA [bacterium BMS3Bbin06]